MLDDEVVRIAKIVLLVAPLIGGVVGFVLQLRQLKKMRLEYSKLALEISSLRHAAAMSGTMQNKLFLEIEDLMRRAETAPNTMKKLELEVANLQRTADLAERRIIIPEYCDRRLANSNMEVKLQWLRIGSNLPVAWPWSVAWPWFFFLLVLLGFAIYGAYRLAVSFPS